MPSAPRGPAGPGGSVGGASHPGPADGGGRVAAPRSSRFTSDLARVSCGERESPLVVKASAVTGSRLLPAHACASPAAHHGFVPAYECRRRGEAWPLPPCGLAVPCPVGVLQPGTGPGGGAEPGRGGHVPRRCRRQWGRAPRSGRRHRGVPGMLRPLGALPGPRRWGGMAGRLCGTRVARKTWPRSGRRQHGLTTPTES